MIARSNLSGWVGAALWTRRASLSHRRYSIYAGDAPGYPDGSRQIARVVRPLALATDTDSGLVVSDLTRVRKVHPDGRVTTLAGTGTSGYLDGRGSGFYRIRAERP